MRRNAAGQKVYAMMRTSASALTVIVPVTASLSVSTATAANPGVFTTATHNAVPGARVTISGGTGSWAAANGDWIVNTVPATTTFSVAALTTGTALDTTGFGALAGTVVATFVPVHVMVTKDGGTNTVGAGTLTHIGRNAAGDAFTATQVPQRSFSATTGTISISACTALTNVAASTLGLWSYTPTAAETNAASVAFTFVGSPRTTQGSGISVTQMFEPTAGPILYQTLLNHDSGAVTNQTTIVLPSANPAPPADDNAFNNAVVVFYDGSTEGQVSACPVGDYVGSTRTLTLRAAPTFTVTTSDYVTIIWGGDSNLKKNAALAKFAFMMTDSTNHAPATGKTVTVTRSIDGGAFAAGSLSAVTEIGNGMYYVDFAAADLNGNVVILRATAAACDDTFERVISQP